MDNSGQKLGAPGTLSRARRIALAMVAIVVAGSIGPWVEVPGASKGGLDGDGVFTIVVAAVAGAYLVFVARPHWAPIVMAGFLTAFASICDIVDIEDLGGFSGDLATPGWGIIVTPAR